MPGHRGAEVALQPLSEPASQDRWDVGNPVKLASTRAGIEGIAEAVADQVDRQHGGEEERPGKDAVLPGLLQAWLAGAHHAAPSGRFGRHPGSQERERGLGQDPEGDDEGALHDQRRKRVHEDVAPHDRHVAHADRPREFGEPGAIGQCAAEIPPLPV